MEHSTLWVSARTVLTSASVAFAGMVRMNERLKVRFPTLISSSTGKSMCAVMSMPYGSGRSRWRVRTRASMYTGTFASPLTMTVSACFAGRNHSGMRCGGNATSRASTPRLRAMPSADKRTFRGRRGAPVTMPRTMGDCCWMARRTKQPQRGSSAGELCSSHRRQLTMAQDPGRRGGRMGDGRLADARALVCYVNRSLRRKSSRTA
mmetsp:Transcript_8638/g.23722  ORF Transcript_8638/g.23722 Transcript_8638/m.23722 type:complete len:206 (+) Transcript_8638:464-1081(+)